MLSREVYFIEPLSADHNLTEVRTASSYLQLSLITVMAGNGWNFSHKFSVPWKIVEMIVVQESPGRCRFSIAREFYFL